MDGKSKNSAGDAIRRVLVEDRADLLRFIQRRVAGGGDAEDVLQRFMVRALERSGDIRNVESVRGWLSRVLATTIADHLRRSRRTTRRHVPLDEENGDRPAVEAQAEIERVVCECLYKLLPTLSAANARVIWRVDILEEPRALVARSLGVSSNALNVRIHRARAALRARLLQMCRTCPIHGFLDCQCKTNRDRAAGPRKDSRKVASLTSSDASRGGP